MVKLRTLGECVIEVGEARIGPDSKVVFALLLFLGLERGKRFTRTALMEMFWPDSPPAKAAHSLRQTIYQCRKLGAEIEATNTLVTLCKDRVQWDLNLEAADAVTSSHPGNCDFLPAYSVDFSKVFDDWLEQQRNIVNGELRRRLLLKLALHKSRGNWEAINDTAHSLLRIDPFNEEGTLVLAESMAMRGDKAGALRVLDLFTKDVGTQQGLHLPATILRRRITEIAIDVHPALNPFVGRSDAIQFLNTNLRDSRQASGRTVLIWGEPGIGKSRLTTEFQQQAALTSVRVIRVACHPADLSRPYSAFTECVPHLLQQRGALGCSPSSLSLLKQLTNHSTNDQEAVEDSGTAFNHSQQVQRAILDLLESVLAEGSLLLIVEDVHWLDSYSWQVISSLCATGGYAGLLLVLTSRTQLPAYSPRELGSTITPYALQALTDQDCRRLFHDLVEGVHAKMSDPGYEWFISVAGGNPYFMRELAKHFADTGETFTIPASLGSLLGAQIRKASPGALRLLQVCALLGRHSTFPRFEKVLEVNSFDLLSALEELEVLDLVSSEGSNVTVKHALLAERALDLCTPATKRLLHRRVAIVLESEIAVTHATSLIWQCADHWSQSGDRSHANQMLTTCAQHLVALGLANAAISLVEGAVAFASEDAERIDSLRALAQAHQATRNWHKVAETLSRIRAISGRASSSTDDDTLLSIVAQFFGSEGDDLPERDELLEPFVRFAGAVENTPLQRVTAAERGLMIADNICAFESMDELHRLTGGLLNDDSLPEIPRLSVRMIYESIRGDAEVGAGCALELIAIHRRMQHAPELLRYIQSASIPLRQLGRFDEAKSLLHEGAALARDRELWNVYASMLDSLGSIELTQNNVACAKRFLEKANDALVKPNIATYRTSINRLGVLTALADGDVGYACKIYSPSDAEFVSTCYRIRDEVLAVHVLLDVRLGRSPESGVLRTLAEAHARSASLSRRDLPAVALLAGLAVGGAKSQATTLAHRYFGEERRERFPLSNYLADILRDSIGESFPSRLSC